MSSETLEQLRQSMKDAVIAVLNRHTREMEGYSYFSSNPGVSQDDYEEIADEVLTSLAALESTPAQELPEDVDAVISCLGDDASAMLDENPEDERALNMQVAAEILTALSARTAPAEGDRIKCPWDNGSPCLDPRPVGMVYPPMPEPRAFGYLDSSGVEWAAYDTAQMEARARVAYSDGWEAGANRAATTAPVVVDGGVTKEQLDWLVANEYDLCTRRELINEDEYAIWWFVVDSRKSTQKHLHTVSGHPLGSPREAIDAAMGIDTARPAKAEGDAQDAARYRWLREGSEDPYVCGVHGKPFGDEGWLTGELLDQAVDNAMKTATARTVSRGDEVRWVAPDGAVITETDARFNGTDTSKYKRLDDVSRGESNG